MVAGPYPPCLGLPLGSTRPVPPSRTKCHPWAVSSVRALRPHPGEALWLLTGLLGSAPGSPSAATAIQRPIALDFHSGPGYAPACDLSASVTQTELIGLAIYLSGLSAAKGDY